MKRSLIISVYSINMVKIELCVKKFWNGNTGCTQVVTLTFLKIWKIYIDIRYNFYVNFGNPNTKLNTISSAKTVSYSVKAVDIWDIVLFLLCTIWKIQCICSLTDWYNYSSLVLFLIFVDFEKERLQRLWQSRARWRRLHWPKSPEWRQVPQDNRGPGCSLQTLWSKLDDLCLCLTEHVIKMDLIQHLFVFVMCLALVSLKETVTDVKFLLLVVSHIFFHWGLCRRPWTFNHDKIQLIFFVCVCTTIVPLCYNNETLLYLLVL